MVYISPGISPLLREMEQCDCSKVGRLPTKGVTLFLVGPQDKKFGNGWKIDGMCVHERTFCKMVLEDILWRVMGEFLRFEGCARSLLPLSPFSSPNLEFKVIGCGSSTTWFFFFIIMCQKLNGLRWIERKRQTIALLECYVCISSRPFCRVFENHLST